MRADGYNVSTFENTANKNLVAMTRRFPAPWSVRELEHAFRVEDVNGQAVAYTYFRRLDTRACSTHDEARRIAAKGAYLLDLVNGLIAHVRCDVNSARRVKNIAQVRFAPDSGPQRTTADFQRSAILYGPAARSKMAFEIDERESCNNVFGL